ELHKRIVEQWADLGLEVVSVGLVDLRGDLQRNTGPLGDFDRSIRSLVVTDAAQEGEVIALAVWMEAMQPCGQAMIDGREPVGGGQGLALMIGNGDLRHLREGVEDRREIGQVEAPVLGRQSARGDIAELWEVQVVEVEVNDVEFR